MDHRRKLALWAILGAVALAAVWVVWPGVMAWRTRSEVYNAAMRQCLANQKYGSADMARLECNGDVRS